MTGAEGQGASEAASASTASQWFDQPPRKLFHVVLVFALAFLMWATSTPAWVFLGLFLGVALLALIGALWCVRRVAFAVARRRGRAVGNPRAFLIAPFMVLLFIGLVAIGAPLRVRWWVSRPWFERVVADAPVTTTNDWQSLRGGRWIGLYTIGGIYKVGDAVIFYETSGGFLDDSGFACLPSGPFPELESGFESPLFSHLSGCWYTWTASW